MISSYPACPVELTIGFTLIGYATRNTKMTVASSEIIMYVSISIYYKP